MNKSGWKNGRGPSTVRPVQTAFATLAFGFALAVLSLFTQAQSPPASPVSATTTNTWQSLWDGKSLAGWGITDFAGKGGVEIQPAKPTPDDSPAELRLLLGYITGIHFTNAFPESNYEIRLEAKRVDGNDFFCGLTFPVNDSHATLIVGGWGGTVFGISSIDGQDASLNETTKIRRFENGRWYGIRIRVEPNRIQSWLDDERLIDLDIKGRAISLRPGDIVLSKPLGIAAWNTASALRKLEWRSLLPPPTPTPPPATPSTPTPTSASPSPDPALSGPGRRLPGDGYQPADLPPGTAPYVLPSGFADIAQKLVSAATESDFAWRRLAEMCDLFGPRFSGSTNLELAIDWVLEQMQADGFESVRGQPVMVPRWVRGEESVSVLHPWKESLPMLGLGGSIATPAAGLTAQVLVVTNFTELQARAVEARGKIVVYDVPFTRYGDSVRYRYSGAVEAAKVGAIASLVRSIGDFGLRTPHTGSMTYSTGVPRIPHAALTAEDTQRLRRTQERGQMPLIHMTMSARQEPDALSRNVIAEIRGWEFPDEVVVVGGHIDSWDVGQGAMDDGGGCLAAWEALRLMKKLGLRPRRTVRCVLWTNEENGLRGARAYRDGHLEEMDRHVVAIESDNGASQPWGFGFTGSDAGLARVRAIGDVLESLISAGQIFKGGADADTGPLLEVGVPVLGLRVDRGRYFWVHHTEADTPDKVDPVQLSKCSAALAIMAYGLADLPEGLPR